MPTVQQFTPPTVAAQTPSRTRAPSTPSGGFERQAPRQNQAVQDLGAGLRAAQLGLKIKQQVDETSAEEALTRFERDKNDLFFNPDSGYFNTSGRDAHDGSEATAKALEELKTRYAADLNSNAATLFNGAADRTITQSRRDIARHSADGLKAWESATIGARVENSLENAALYWENPQELAVQREIGRQAVLDKASRDGLDSEAQAEQLQNFESTFARNAVTAATQQSSAAGQETFDRYIKRLEGPDQIKLRNQIASKKKAEDTALLAAETVAQATVILDENESRTDVIAAVREIEDPVLRGKVHREAMQQFDKRKAAQAEERVANYEAAERFIDEGGTVAEYETQFAEEWESLSPKQQKSLTSGELIQTDWDTFSNLMTMPNKDLAKVDPSDYFDRLARTERSKLVSAVRSARGQGSKSAKTDHQIGRSRSSETTAAVEQLFGKRSKWNDNRRAQANAFYALVDSEATSRESQLQRQLTSEEYTNLLSDMTRTVVQEGFIFDTELDLSDVPSEDIPTISRFLRDNNVQVTADNIIRAYQQATQ